jgi:hypothetical protein
LGERNRPNARFVARLVLGLRAERRVHDGVCALAVGTQDPGRITQFLGDFVTTLENASGNNGTSEGLLVEDGYESPKPTYGQDITICSPQVLQLTGPVVNSPGSANPVIMARIWGGTPR